MSKKRNALREYIEAFTFAIIAALILRALVIQAFRIPTGSMKDTLLVGDFLLVNKFIYGVRTPDRIMFTDIKIPYTNLPALKKPERGDIIVFKYPRNEKLDYIKRCVALPGDTLQVKDGIVYINSKLFETSSFKEKKYDKEDQFNIDYYNVENADGRKYTIRKYHGIQPKSRNFGPVVIPDDHLFMMGDNRDNSADSRSWGFLPMQNVVGQALVIYWSWDKFPPLWQIFNKVRWERIFGIIQ